MNIELDKNQNLIGREARRFLLKECSSEFIKELYDSETGFDRELWKKMAALDWMALNIPEAYNGVNAGLMDLCVLLEEMGRALLPGPYFSTALLSAPILMEGGTEEQKKAWLPKIAVGEIKTTLALHEAKAVNNGNGVKIKKTSYGFVVSGTKILVPYAAVADVIFVPVFHENDQSLVTILMVEKDDTGIECNLLKTIDGSRRFYEVKFHSLYVPFKSIIGKEKESRNILDCVMSKAMVGMAAENIGGAQIAMELAVDYAKNRVQFGKPIGSFQAIKHQITDMKIDIDGAKILMYYAAWSCENNTSDSHAAVLAAYINSTEVYERVTNTATHIHGALGVTWENDMHLFYKRAWANKYFFGECVKKKSELANSIIDLMVGERL